MFVSAMWACLRVDEWERALELFAVRQAQRALPPDTHSYAAAIAACAKGAAARIRDYAPMDATLHGIADRLQAIQRRNFYQLAAEASHRGRYYHEYTMSVDVSRDSVTWQPPTEDAQEVVTEALRDLARWLYRQLEAEYDHFTSDEAIEEGIIVNEYTFTEGGRRFG